MGSNYLTDALESQIGRDLGRPRTDWSPHVQSFTLGPRTHNVIDAMGNMNSVPYSDAEPSHLAQLYQAANYESAQRNAAQDRSPMVGAMLGGLTGLKQVGLEKTKQDYVMSPEYQQLQAQQSMAAGGDQAAIAAQRQKANLPIPPLEALQARFPGMTAGPDGKLLPFDAFTSNYAASGRPPIGIGSPEYDALQSVYGRTMLDRLSNPTQGADLLPWNAIGPMFSGSYPGANARKVFVVPGQAQPQVGIPTPRLQTPAPTQDPAAYFNDPAFKR